MNNYLYSDFVFLCAAAKKNTQRLSDVFVSASVALQFPLTRHQLLHALGCLKAGGYITFDTCQAHSDMLLSVTDKGKKAVKVGFPASLISSAKHSALLKLENEFTAREIDIPVCDISMHDDEYVSVNRKLYADYSVLVPFVDAEMRDGTLAFRFRSASCSYTPLEFESVDSEDSDGDEISRDSLDVVCRDINLADGLLSAVCDFLLVSSKVRKFALEGLSGVYLFSLSYVNDGSRLTAAKILYNKNRFIGKRDSDLDYAQCSDNLLDITIPPALLSSAVLRAYSSVPNVLSAQMLEKMRELRRLGV